MSGKTNRLNLSMTSCYNADFDGDEMNIHRLQDYASIAEAQVLTSVESQVLNAQNNRPCVGLVQDSLLGIYLLTRPGVYLTKSQICQMCSGLTVHPKLPVPAILKPRELWTGKQVISCILPDISFENGDVLVLHGELLTGTLDNRTVGSSASRGVVHVICKMVDNRAALDFLYNAQKVVSQWMEGYGFTIGYAECYQDRKDTDTTVRNAIDIIQKAEVEGNALGVDPSVVERNVMKMVAQLLDRSGGMMKEKLHPDNSLLCMVESGSKGNMINVSQILACVGQQSLLGQRIGNCGRNNTRTLNHFTVGCSSV